MFAFVAALSLSTGVVFSVVPALRATGIDTAAALKESGRGISSSNRLLSEALLAVQFAVSVVLLVGAALFLQTLGNLRGVDIGFEPSNILLFRIDPKLNGYEEERTAAVYDNVAESLRLLPGVQSVSVSDLTFLSHRISTQTVHVEGPNVAQGMRPNMNEVSPEFFETMGIPLLVGRLFDSRDRKEAPQVAIVNEAAVQEYWGGENPVGKRVGPRPADSGQIEIVGVVQNVKYLSVRDAPPPIVYVPHAQTSSRFGRVFSLKTAGPPRALIPEVQDAVRRIDPELPMLDISTQAEKIEEGFSRERMFALAYALFGILAMVLASVGLFGLTSYGVGQRTHEFGIRMALGARSSEVSRLVLRGSIRLIVVGVGLGVLASLAASRVIESLLFELAPTDASAIVQAVVVMTVVALVAAYLPARRAASVDPLIALRCD